eukprot:PhM_4_TR18596/c2_g1_i1/m.55069
MGCATSSSRSADYASSPPPSPTDGQHAQATTSPLTALTKEEEDLLRRVSVRTDTTVKGVLRHTHSDPHLPKIITTAATTTTKSAFDEEVLSGGADLEEEQSIISTHTRNSSSHYSASPPISPLLGSPYSPMELHVKFRLIRRSKNKKSSTISIKHVGEESDDDDEDDD